MLALQHIVREPQGNPRNSAPLLLLLHGLRSNEQDLIGLAPALDRRFFLVSARAPLTMAYGAYAWYNVEFTPTGYVINAEEAERSRVKIVEFVRQLIDSYNIDSARVYVMGFSQGAAMSVAAALSEPALFAGVTAMSGRFIDELAPSAAPPERLAGMPMMVVHGTHDGVIPIEHGRMLRDRLSGLPVKLTYREYEMAHEVTQQSIGDINGWLGALLDSDEDWRSAGAR